MSKKGFLLGVVLGGAAIATAVMKMDDDKKAELKAKAQQGLADFKNRAIDYAFYANDAAEDFKAEAGQELAKVEDDEDIVIDGGAAYQKAGEDEKTSAPVPESAPAKDATPAKSNDESTTDESSPAK